MKLYKPRYSQYSNPGLLKSRANLNQNKFLLNFGYTFTVILPLVNWTLDNSNLPLISISLEVILTLIT